MPEGVKSEAIQFLARSSRQNEFPIEVSTESDLGAQIKNMVGGYGRFLDSPETRAEITRMLHQDTSQLTAESQGFRMLGFGFLGFVASLASIVAACGVYEGGRRIYDFADDWRYQRKIKSAPHT